MQVESGKDREEARWEQRELERRDGSTQLTSNVSLDLRDIIPRRIHRNKDRSSDRSMFRIYQPTNQRTHTKKRISQLSRSSPIFFLRSRPPSPLFSSDRSEAKLTKDINHIAHLIQLLGTDIRTVCEPKVHQGPFPKEVGFGEGVSILVEEREGSSDQGFAGFDRFLSGSFTCIRRRCIQRVRSGQLDLSEKGEKRGGRSGLKGREGRARLELTLDLIHLCLLCFKVEVETCSCCQEDSCTSEVEELLHER